MRQTAVIDASPPPELPGVRHEYLNADGLRMHVAMAGPDDAPPVLLVHGWPQHWWEWRHVIPLLNQAHRLIVPDLRGFGWTEAPRHGYEKDQLARDLMALLDALGLQRVTYVGHDWGAYVGLLAALDRPERFERMLTLCIPHLWWPRDPRLIPVFLSYQGPISLPLLGPAMADFMVRRVLQLGRGPDPLAPADVALFAEHIPRRTTVAMYRTFLTRELPASLQGRFRGRRLEVPTTHMVGELDLVTRGARPGPDPRQPELGLEVIPRVAHWVPEQRPAAIADWVLTGAR